VHSQWHCLLLVHVPEMSLTSLRQGIVAMWRWRRPACSCHALGPLQDKLALLWRLECPAEHAFCADLNFWSHALEYVPDPDELAEQIHEARNLWASVQPTRNATV
jgi:hypothetical protein